MALQKSKSEIKGDVLLRVIHRGKASLRETAVLLDKSWPTIKAHVGLGKIEAIGVGSRFYVTIPELIRQGLVLPSIPELSDRIKILLTEIDANTVDLGDIP